MEQQPACPARKCEARWVCGVAVRVTARVRLSCLAGKRPLHRTAAFPYRATEKHTESRQVHSGLRGYVARCFAGTPAQPHGETLVSRTAAFPYRTTEKHTESRQVHGDLRSRGALPRGYSPSKALPQNAKPPPAHTGRGFATRFRFSKRIQGEGVNPERSTQHPCGAYLK